MPEQIEDTAYRVWWTVRRYLWVFLFTIPAAVVLLVSTAPGTITQQYETSALVVATKRGDLATESMARLYESVFEGGAVAEIAVRQENLNIVPQDLIPDYASIEPVENTVAAEVFGTHDEPGVAKRIADGASAALVAELNRVFDGESVFARVAAAPTPEAEVTSVSKVTPVALGIAIGIVAGLGIIGLLLTLRRPILGGDEASALVGAPLVGTPTLPAGRGFPAAPSRVPGLAAMVKRLFPDAAGSVVFIAHTRGEEVRTIVAQLVAGALGRFHPTFLVRSRDQDVQHLYVQWESNPKIVVTESLPDVSTWKRMPIVIDGPSAKGTDAPQLIPEFAQIVLVVRQGASRHSVFEVSSQFLPGEITGVLFVRRGRSWPWHSSPRADATANQPSMETPTSAQPKPSVDPERRPSREQDAAERAAREARYKPERPEAPERTVQPRPEAPARTAEPQSRPADAQPRRVPQATEQPSLLGQAAHRPPQQRFEGRPEGMRDRPERAEPVEERATEARTSAGDDDPVSRRDD